ncbi:MAG: acyl transferase [Saprospiraceae bacterium]
MREALLHQINNIETQDFTKVSLAIFHYQATHNALYRKYLQLLGCRVAEVQQIADIPFLPISLFKNYQIQTGEWKAVRSFSSSGTTGQTTSKHHLRSLRLYDETCRKIFKHFYGDPQDYCFLALLPSYLEREGSSLVYMVDQFIQDSRYAESGFFLDNQAALIQRLEACQTKGIPTVLIGVSFALWDLAKQYSRDLSNIIIMETGGMKGRAKEITRTELHQILGNAFQLRHIHSEYGMTELLSQAYAKEAGLFHPAPTMKVQARQISDPLSLEKIGRTGALNIIDLANLDSCAFIATDDLAKVYEDGSFEVLGRLDDSEIRGCNLMITDIL